MTYEYKCEECGDEFSVVQNLKEHEEAKVCCPQCGSENTKHLMESFYAKTSRKS